MILPWRTGGLPRLRFDRGQFPRGNQTSTTQAECAALNSRPFVDPDVGSTIGDDYPVPIDSCALPQRVRFTRRRAGRRDENRRSVLVPVIPDGDSPERGTPVRRASRAR